jgi:hypothetical protein
MNDERGRPVRPAGTWVRPAVARLAAGAAEIGANPNNPEGQIAYGS